MVVDALAVVLCVTVFAATLLMLAAIFRFHVRRYDRRAAADLLDDWQMWLRLLDPAGRERALLSPPPNVVAAMVALPAAGRRARR